MNHRFSRLRNFGSRIIQILLGIPQMIWSARKWIFRVGVVFGVIIAAGFILIKVTHATYLLSPGELSNVKMGGGMLGGVASHAELERKCSHCHAPVHCVEDTRCQDCHMDIATDRTDISTLHGRLPGVTKCQNCHPEHNGADADLTLLPYLNVDHYLLAGFSLEKHVTNYDGSSMNCESCHTQDVNLIETIDCVECHSGYDHDYIASHIEKFGKACAECHDGSDRMLTGFVHEPYFSLQGGHRELECSQCHNKEQYVDLASTCNSCHEEPEVHAGVFGTTCENCHSAIAWVPAQLKQHAFGLQHGGEPIDDCQTCHTETFTACDCGSCHKDEELNLAQMNQQAEQQGLMVQSNNANNNPSDHTGPEMQDCLSCHPNGVISGNAQNRGEERQGGNGTGGNNASTPVPNPNQFPVQGPGNR